MGRGGELHAAATTRPPPPASALWLLWQAWSGGGVASARRRQAATMAQAATFTPFRSSSFAGQRVVAKSSSVARSAVLRQPVQCRTLEAGAWAAHAGAGPSRRCARALTPSHATCACRSGHLWHQGGHDAGGRRRRRQQRRRLACGPAAAARAAGACHARFVGARADELATEHPWQPCRWPAPLPPPPAPLCHHTPCLPLTRCRTPPPRPQFFKDGAALPATVIALEGGNIVTQVKTEDKDGYAAVQVRPAHGPNCLPMF